MSAPAPSITCPACSAKAPVESRFCPSCGQAIVSPWQATTAAPPGDTVPISSGTVPVGGFAPGTVLLSRYRIVGLVGRGGMGEVYRADDLKLGQPVALKFLPMALAADPVRRERFFAEVRITRQLSHPNICRVYDIAEFEGQHFLSMEFVDGEDLSSLIRRIGHLTNEKTLDVARQLAAGLSAAHERGVLHRDLKPANVMIDGHGRVRITDFGMAIVMEDETQTREIAGTPAYMAPEQLAGKGATVRSDIYALGLILYELCSGKRAFTAGTLAELREQKANHTPRSVSDIRIDVDPNLERLVTRCIDRDPRGRPASVAQITAALPGGDPLAAAVRAGETPSPEMVAAAGLKEGIQPAAGIALLAFVVLGILALTGMSQALSLPAGQSQEVLTDRVRDLIKDFGYDVRGADRAFGYSSDTTLTALVTRYGPDKAWELWSKAKFDSARFWYRESPAPIVHREILSPAVSFSDPDLSVTGEIRVEVNAQGQLRRFEALPPAADAPESSSAPQEVWSVLFSEAGLDLSRFSPAEAPWRPFLHADTWAAWEGARLDAPEIPIRVEAAAYAGKPVYFRVKGPWSNPAKPTSRDRWTVVSVLIAVGAVFIGAISLVRRNARLGRGDRRGATRLAFLILGLSTASWILREHHVASIAELILLLSFAREALFMAVAIWLLYMAIEPVIRRRWPESLISWTRLLAGEWRDPLVGRDILVGCAAGVTFGVLGRLRTLTTQWFGGRAFDIVIVGPWHGGRAGALVASFLDIGGIVALALGFLVAFFLLQKLLRKNWITVSVLGLLLATTVSMLDRSWLGFVQTPFIVLLFAVLITRFGLLALVISLFVSSRLNTALTFDVSEWYFPVGLATALFVFALSFAALRISLGGARLLQDTDD